MRFIQKATLIACFGCVLSDSTLRTCMGQDAAAVIAVLGKCIVEVAGHHFSSKKGENIILDLPWIPVPTAPVAPGKSPPPVDALVIDPSATHQDDPKHPHYAMLYKFGASSTIENKKATISTLSAETSDKSGALAIAIPPHLHGHNSTVDINVTVFKGDAIVYVIGDKSGRLAKSPRLKKDKDGKQSLKVDVPKGETVVLTVELSAESSVKVSGVTAVAR